MAKTQGFYFRNNALTPSALLILIVTKVHLIRVWIQRATYTLPFLFLGWVWMMLFFSIAGTFWYACEVYFMSGIFGQDYDIWHTVSLWCVLGKCETVVLWTNLWNMPSVWVIIWCVTYFGLVFYFAKSVMFFLFLFTLLSIWQIYSNWIAVNFSVLTVYEV